MEVGHKTVWWRVNWIKAKIKMSFCCVIYQFDSEFFIFYNMYNGRSVRSPRETGGLFCCTIYSFLSKSKNFFFAFWFWDSRNIINS